MLFDAMELEELPTLAPIVDELFDEFIGWLRFCVLLPPKDDESMEGVGIGGCCGC